jgi:hypothetical protein
LLLDKRERWRGYGRDKKCLRSRPFRYVKYPFGKLMANTAQLSHRVRSLHHIPASGSFLAASPDAITILSPTLQPTHLPLTISGKSASAAYSNLIKTFLPARAHPTDPISVVLVYSSGSVRLLTITVDETSETFRLDGEKSIVFPKTVLVTHEIVADAHLDEVKGTLHYYSEYQVDERGRR